MANKIGINFDFWKIIRLVGWTGLIILMVYLLSGCAADVGVKEGDQPDYENWLNPRREVSDQVSGVILPHHLLVEGYMEKFYSQLADENSYDRVIILAPNHFGYGYNFIQTTDVINTDEQTIDSESREMLRNAPELDLQWIAILETAKVVFIEPKYFSREHGVFTHYAFLKKYFPKAKIVPLIIKSGATEKSLINLGEELKALINADDGRTLILASLDFSHYSDEELAVKNDWRMLQWLAKIKKGSGQVTSLESAREVGKSFDLSNSEAVAIDSPEVLYLMSWLMQEENYSWQFWARTSSASLIDGVPGTENTSHIFGYFI